jgi:quercetin dioxygenase-like cupin family protein
MGSGSRPSAQVFRAAEQRWTERAPKVNVVHLLGRWTGSSEMLSGMTELAAGATVPLHTHNCEEAVLVLSGRARFDAGSESHDLLPGDVAWAAAGVEHRYVNVGDDPLRIFWTYGSVDARRTFVDSNESHSIESEVRRDD